MAPAILNMGGCHDFRDASEDCGRVMKWGGGKLRGHETLPHELMTGQWLPMPM